MEGSYEGFCTGVGISTYNFVLFTSKFRIQLRLKQWLLLKFDAEECWFRRTSAFERIRADSEIRSCEGLEKQNRGAQPGRNFPQLGRNFPQLDATFRKCSFRA